MAATLEIIITVPVLEIDANGNYWYRAQEISLARPTVALTDDDRQDIRRAWLRYLREKNSPKHERNNWRQEGF